MTLLSHHKTIHIQTIAPVAYGHNVTRLQACSCCKVDELATGLGWADFLVKPDQLRTNPVDCEPGLKQKLHGAKQ